jgi:HK97 family phage major capsid protein
MDKLRVKIQIPENIIAREGEADKRLKTDGDYQDVGWRVLGVPYGGPIKGRDLDGEAFHEETNIWLKTGDQVNLTYYHGFGPDEPDSMQEMPVIIGRAIYTGKDERGHWFEPRFDFEEPLAQRIIKAGAELIRASSGAVSHLVRMGKGGLINVWPVGELALFDVNEWRLPANDLAVIEAKAETVTEAIPEAVETAVDAVDVEAEAKLNTTITEIPEEGITTMTDEVLEPIEKKEPVEQVTKADLEALKKSIVEELKAAPGKEKGKPTVKAPAVIDHVGETDYRKAYWRYIRTGETDDLKRAAKLNVGALEEGTTTEGGYLVPDDEYGSIIAKRDEASIISKLGVMRVKTDRDKFNFPAEGTSLSKFTIVDEEGAISDAEDEPTFGQEQVTIYKFTKLIKVSEELMWDENSNLEAFLNNALGRAWADTENYYALIGADTTQPEGAFVGGTAALTLDSASAIGAAEIPELMGKLGTPYHNGAAWVMDPATWFYLKGLTSASVFTFTTGLARMSGTVDGPTLEGYPVVLNSNAATIAASAKTLLFGNFDYLGWVENRGFRVRRLNELYAGTGQIGILAQMRFGCRVLQAEAFQYATHPTA